MREILFRGKRKDKDEWVYGGVLQSKSKIILSGYDNDLYNEMLHGWRTDTKATTAQMGLHRTEKIWLNF